MTDRTVRSQWDGDLRAVVEAGGFELVVDEPVSAGGSGKGPQPTDLFLAAVASCMTLSMSYSARKRDIVLEGLDVTVTGTYDGPQFAAIRIAVRADKPEGEELQQLVASAERVCYVTRTIKLGPEITTVIEE